MTQDELKSIVNYNPLTGIFTWKVSNNTKIKIGSRAGSFDKSKGYRKIRINKILYKEHRVAWFYVYGVWPSDQLDHKNTNKVDNSIDNLREATNSTNGFNKTKYKTNKSGYKGVSWYPKMNKWVVKYSYNRKIYHGGYFDKVEDAAKKYKELTKNLHGEFANYE